jgi:hypothetical protein
MFLRTILLQRVRCTYTTLHMPISVLRPVVFFIYRSVLYSYNFTETVTYTNLVEDAETQVCSPDSIPYSHYMPIPPHKELQWGDKTLLNLTMNSLDMLSTQRYQSETKNIN